MGAGMITVWAIGIASFEFGVIVGAIVVMVVNKRRNRLDWWRK